MIHRYGGHAMAAGLTIHRDSLETLARLFGDVARERIAPELFDAVLLSDGELCGDDFKLDLAEQLRFGGPWGQAFPEPVFDGTFAVDSWRVMGETHLRFNLRCDGFLAPLEAVMFNCYAGSAPPNRFRAAYSLDINEWNGASKLRLLLRHVDAI
jgi:single-stranded-DNA-specific exonuclease